jgi:hypothetical protein
MGEFRQLIKRVSDRFVELMQSCGAFGLKSDTALLVFAAFSAFLP